MGGVKDNEREGKDEQRKHRRTARLWDRIPADRGSQRFAFLGVPSHWHQDNLAEETKEKARIRAPEIASGERRSCFKEVTLTYSPEKAMEEASRCLRCDLEVEG